MQPRSRAIVLVIGLITTHAVWAGAPAVSRVLPADKLPDDSRLGKPADLNHPAQFTPKFSTRAEWEQRARRLREQALVALGLWPMPKKMPLKPVVTGRIEREDYTIENVYIESLPGHFVTGNLYRPKRSSPTGRLPGVLCPHGHWRNGRFFERSKADAEKEIKSGAEKTLAGARYPLQARCAMLARMGCVVFHYDMVGYADSKAIPHRAGFTDAEAELRLQSAMGLQTWNSIRALDYLASLPEVDPSRLAVTGSSGGGTQTFVLCAVDPRPAVAFPAVMVSTAMQGGCICENCSHFRVGTNNIELAALFAPKPLAMTGANDWTREIETKGLPELRYIYRLYDAEDRVLARYFPFPHNYNQVSREMMYNWFNRHLHLGWPEPVTEAPFKPVPPKELSVFPGERPKEADAKGIRRYLSDASDRQMEQIAREPKEYRRVVGTALRVMIHENLEQSADTVSRSFTKVERDGYEIHKVLLTRQGTGERVPALGLVPEGWRRTLVIWITPQGKAGLFDRDGEPIALVRQLLDRGWAVMSGDCFLTGEFHLPDKPTPAPKVEQQYHKDLPFAGYTYGYNRTLLAERVHDILTCVDFAHRVGAERVYLVGVGKAGPWTLLARALAGNRIDRAAVDLNRFDFDSLTSTSDEMFLPGAVKYGGIYGFVPLCTHGETALFNAPKGGTIARARKTPGVHIRHDGSIETMIDWLAKQ